MRTDARIKYTKMIICKVFLELLGRLPIEKITVAEICRLAEINRATFYRYYENQYDLLSTLENEMFDEIKRSVHEYRNDIDRLTEIMFIKLYEQKEKWVILLSGNADLSFQPKLYAFFDEFFAKTYTTKEKELRYRFLLSGYSGIFDYWVKNGMKEPPQEISECISKFRHDLIKGI